MKLSLIVFVTLLALMASASDVNVNEDFDATTEEFIEVKAKTAASLFDSVRHGVQATQQAKMLQVQHMKSTMESLTAKHPELAVQIGIINYSELQSKGDGYGEMKDIMDAIDALYKKIEGEATEALTNITAVRNQCAKDIKIYRNAIINSTDAINKNNSLVKINRASNTRNTNSIKASMIREASNSSNISVAKSKSEEMSSAYWERRNHRDRERRVLKLALFLTCDFRSYSADPYCVWLKQNMEVDVPKGCDIVITGGCTLEPEMRLKFEDELGYITSKSNQNSYFCAKRAVYYYDRCGNNVTRPVTATFRANPIAFTYPNQNVDSWYKNVKEQEAQDDKNYNLKMENNSAQRAVDLKALLTKEAADDLDRQKKMAEAGLTLIPTVNAPLPTVKPAATDAFVQESAAQELKDEITWDKKKIAAKRAINLAKMDKVMQMGTSQEYIRIFSQARNLMANGSLDTLDSEASEDVKATRASLIDLLKNLRSRLKSEQEAEDADYKQYLKELDAIISTNKDQMNAEKKLQSDLQGQITSSLSQIATSVDLITTNTKTLGDNSAAYTKTSKSCKEAEDDYIVSKFSSDTELNNVNKLRSVLRVLATSDLPKCPNDCTRPEQGYCQWKGRFGADSQCTCEPEFYGIDCNKRKCNGSGTNPVARWNWDGYGSLYPANAIDACTNSNRGICDNDVKSKTAGKCICKTNYYHGPKEACEYKRCPGNASYDPRADPNQTKACNGNGVCNISTGVCTCNASGRAYGTACELTKCYNYLTKLYLPATDPTSCAGHGSCNPQTGKCVCDSTPAMRYYGDNCELRKCAGDCQGQNSSCNTSTGICACSTERYGDFCQFSKCPGGCNAGVPGNYCDVVAGRCVCRANSNNGGLFGAVYSGKNCAQSKSDVNWSPTNYNPNGNSWNTVARDYPSYVANWWGSFDAHRGGRARSDCDQSKRTNSLIMSLWFNDCDGIWCIEGAFCGSPSLNGQILSVSNCVNRPFSSRVYGTWSSNVGATAECRDDEYLKGLERRWSYEGSNLIDIQYGYCCKIQSSTAKNCWDDRWDSGGNFKGKWVGQGFNHFWTGIIRKTGGEGLSQFVGARVCSFQYNLYDI